jgi:NAD(P)H dehydrogenase (quinone)
MAATIGKAVEGAGVSCLLRKVDEVKVQDLVTMDGLLLGSPCYFGNMSNQMKLFVDESIQLFGKGELEGKPGGAFVSTGGIGGCGEVALQSLLNAMLIHGMVVQGVRKGGHLGPLAIGEPDERALAECEAYGARFAELVKRLA